MEIVVTGAHELLLSVAVVVIVLGAINKEERAKELLNHLCQGSRPSRVVPFASVNQGNIICNKS